MQSNEAHRVEVTPEAFAALIGPKTVYIREMAPSEIAKLPGLPEELEQSAGPIKLYSIHASDGTRVAVLDDRDAAFIAARQNEMDPVSVH